MIVFRRNIGIGVLSRWAATVVFIGASLLMAACGSDERTLTVYSGRTSSLVDPLLQQFAAERAVKVQVRYGTTAGTAALILEEGSNSPADVVFLQDAGALGALEQADVLDRLPDEILDRVDRRLRSPNGAWVGTSGRARTVIYNTETINPDTDLPDSILDFTDPKWKGKIGWAPTNGSFQAFVTAMRVQLGEDATRAWLEGIKANEPQVYANNVSIVAAAGNGEVQVGFVNHYYLHRFLAEHGPGFKARNYYIGNGDPGALINVAGAGILKTSKNKELGQEFLRFLLSKEGQAFFAQETDEYPLSAGVQPASELPPLETLDPPDIDLGNLADLQGTLALLRETGVLP